MLKYMVYTLKLHPEEVHAEYVCQSFHREGPSARNLMAGSCRVTLSPRQEGFMRERELGQNKMEGKRCK